VQTGNREHCSFPADPVNRTASAPPLPAGTGGSLLQRRRSSAGAKARPILLAPLSQLQLPDLPDPNAIYEHIIGHSAAAEHDPSHLGDDNRVLGIVEKTFDSTKNRRPTPYPEKESFIDDDELDEDESVDEDDEKELKDQVSDDDKS
jgi:hypothetical protein